MGAKWGTTNTVAELIQGEKEALIRAVAVLAAAHEELHPHPTLAETYGPNLEAGIVGLLSLLKAAGVTEEEQRRIADQIDREARLIAALDDQEDSQ